MCKLALIALSSFSAAVIAFLVTPAGLASPAPPGVDVPGIPDETVQYYGLRNIKPPIMEIGRSIHVIGRIDKTATVEAEVWIAGKSKPEYHTVRLAPGTWLLPDELYLSPNQTSTCERIDDAK